MAPPTLRRPHYEAVDSAQGAPGSLTLALRTQYPYPGSESDNDDPPSPSKCCFLDFPREVRLRIYELTFDPEFYGGTSFVGCNPEHKSHTIMRTEHPCDTIGVLPGLLGVSKQVREESHRIFLDCTVFVYRLVVNVMEKHKPYVFKGIFGKKIGPFAPKKMAKVRISIKMRFAKLVADKVKLDWSGEDGRGMANVRTILWDGGRLDPVEDFDRQVLNANVISKSLCKVGECGPEAWEARGQIERVRFTMLYKAVREPVTHRGDLRGPS